MRAPRPQSHKTAGEPLVWLTSIGLSLGLLMILGLLAIIVVNGLRVFWPKRVIEVQFKERGSFSFMGTNRLAGEIVKEQRQIVQSVADNQADARELQFYLGNKDVYGLNFVYVSQSSIAEMRYPGNILVIERIEYGNAVGYPVALRPQNAPAIPASDPSFAQRLAALNREANERRERIEKIERTQIGKINARMTKLRLRQRAGPAAQAKQTRTEDEMKELQSRYEALAQSASALRQQQSAIELVYRLPTGQEHAIPIGNLVSFRYPNQLSLWQRAGWFAQNAWGFLADDPREANTEGGVFPAIFGTAVMTLIMSIAVVPFGVLAAIYLREYAKQGVFVRAVRIAVNNLAGVPSIVFGVFGLGFFVYFIGSTIDEFFFSSALPTPTFGTGAILWASLTLALMTVPVVIVATEEALTAVPRGMREGSLACGASKWQTIRRIILPSAVPGILTGLILAMARGAGEVAPLMLVGVVKLAPSLPLDAAWPFIHFERKFMHLGFHIYDLGFQSPDSEAAKPMVFATTLLLILLVVLLNLGAIVIRERIRRKYAMGAF
ncbi:MAG: phosphate ABC transporter permease PstA [Verrucomicrobia subdivision 3 bacterium]|nr:phosphate ABC transporter permease PstA [Limisphaerales bacterium]